MKRILLFSFILITLHSFLFSDDPIDDSARIHFSGLQYVDVWFSSNENETTRSDTSTSFSREFLPRDDFSFVTEPFYLHCRICVVEPVTVTLTATPLYKFDLDTNQEDQNVSVSWTNISEDEDWAGIKISSDTSSYAIVKEDAQGSEVYSIFPRDYSRQFILKANVSESTANEYYQGYIKVKVTP